MGFSQLAENRQLLHRQQLAIRNDQGTGLGDFPKGFSRQLVKDGFVNLKESANRLVASPGLDSNRPGFDQGVSFQYRTGVDGDLPTVLDLGQKIEDIPNHRRGSACLIEKGFSLAAIDNES